MNTQWKKYIFKFNEIYTNGEKDSNLKKATVNIYFHQSKPVQTNKKFSIHRQALHLYFDLFKSEEVLMSEMSSTTRYKIRRAKRDNVTVKFIEHPDLNDIDVFAGFYNSFAKRKGIELCKLEKLIALMKNDMLIISYVFHEDGTALAFNATIANKGTAIGLYGGSVRFSQKNISGQYISRANRYLHWCEMIYFKRHGYHSFDMMGLTMDKNNTDHQRINEYKRSFGGQEKFVYQSFVPQNSLGTILILILKFLWRNNTEIINNTERKLTEYSDSKNR